MQLFSTKYGYFDDGRDEYVITRPDTPRPWVNVICPGDYGVTVSQTGSGYSWRTHASLNRITRWEQDLIRDDWGKYVYVRDCTTGQIWSLGWKPVAYSPTNYRVHHGIGYSRLVSFNADILSEMTVFVPKNEPLEVWLVQLENRSSEGRHLSLFSYFEWGLGAAPDWHREFHKTFIETGYDTESEILWAKKRLWEIPNAKGQHWNRPWEYLAFHGASEPVVGYEGDKESFLGMYRSLANPKAVEEGKLGNSAGKWGDAIGSLHVDIALPPGGSKTIAFFLGAVRDDERRTLKEMVAKYCSIPQVQKSFAEVREFWRGILSTPRVETPDKGFNLMTNTWLKYQAISGRLWGRTGYYQTGGAYGFRDQLQDSQVFLPIDPAQTGEQIKLHAAHQFTDGRVNHWWHPLSEIGCDNKISDNRLWMAFVAVNYLKETADFEFLKEKVPYRDGDPGSIYDHCRKAIEYNLERLSPRGLPLIGDGDWNDGMNAVGFEGRGESIWLGHFLYHVLVEFSGIAERIGDRETVSRYRRAAEDLRNNINLHGWDGEWYIRAVCDDGTVLGSSSCQYGRIFLNAQTWAIIAGIAEGERSRIAYNSVKRFLSREYGPILFYPAYQEPDERVGYLTRYAPGVREHAGLYTHAGTWAVMAAAKMRDAEEAWRMYRNMCPVYRGMEPDLYKVEPYVTPGNVDGPDSPNFGRGGWTWYTGSAAWMLRVGTEWILGVRPEYDGLRVDPCIPSNWDGFAIRRAFRGGYYDIRVINPDHVSHGVKEVVVDGVRLGSNLIPVHTDGKEHSVLVTLGI